MRSLIKTTLLMSLIVYCVGEDDNQWSWQADDDRPIETAKPFTEDDIQFAETSFIQSNSSDVDEIINNILVSTRQGRNLKEFDEVYSDPNIQEALQKGDDSEARNLIRDKLCGLGLMQCDGVQAKRPYISPEDLVYAQPVAINPVGRPIPSIPVKGPIRGTYGPPRPVPFPPNHSGNYGPPRRGYGPIGPPLRPPSKPFYTNKPPFVSSSGFSGSSFESSEFISSKPQFETGGSDFPYQIQHSSSFHQKDKKPVEVVVNAHGGSAIGGTGSASTVQQHVHHHFHHGDSGEKIPIPIVVKTPVPIVSSDNSNGLIGTQLGGFKVSNFGDIYSSNLNSGYKDTSYASNAGLTSSTGGIFSTSSGSINTPSLTIGGSSLSGSYGGQSIANYGASSGLGNYAGVKPVSETYGPQTFDASSLYNSNSIGASAGYYGSSTDFYKKELNVNGLQSNSLLGGSYTDKYQGLESARGENYDCVCVPYDQCPSHEVLGRKDDLLLPLDPRSLKTDIEAEEERVVTDSNGTMSVIRVPKSLETNVTEIETSNEPERVKREAPPEKKSEEKPEARQVSDFTKNIKPTFGVSFGLPQQYGGIGYPYPNTYGPNYPYQTNGINLGLISVNPLISLQVTKDDYGEKIFKPTVNLHVTPNDFLVHKVKNFLDFKKEQLFNKHEHYHHHEIHKPHYHKPHYVSKPFYEHYEEPEYIPHYYEEQFHNNDDTYHYGDEYYGYDDDFYGRSVSENYTGDNTAPYQYQNKLEGIQNSYAQNYGTNEQYPYNDRNVERQNNQNSFQNHDNSRRGKSIQTSSSVKFPNNRRRREATDTENIEPDSKIEKRQSYFGGAFGRPPTCGPRHVCCRRSLRPNIPTLQGSLRQCGTRHSQGINGRIKNPIYVDGDSEFGEYPWQVAILKKDPKESVYVCGGTLIDQLHILTAAHCVKTYTAFDLRARLGEWDVNHDVEFFPYIERDVVSVNVHPEFYAGTLYNDIAIIKLDRPVDWSKHPHISPACLPSPHEEYAGSRCWTTGWGKDAFGDFGKYQNILKEVDVPVIGFSHCQQQLRQTRLGYDFKLHPGFICAGGEEGKDACKGDGGGPMVCERGGSWKVVGIVSWGIGCGQVGVPGVYVKVTHYLDWIRQITQRY